jgi:diguanylate cyclase (GGDEF)-like protein
MKQRPARPSPSAPRLADRWPDLLIGALAVAALVLEPLVPPAARAPAAGVWLCAAAGAVLAAVRRRDGGSSDADGRGLRLLFLAATALRVLAVLAKSFAPLREASAGVSPSFWLLAYAMVIVITASRIPGRMPALVIAVVAVALEGAALAGGGPGAPASAAAWFGAGAGLALLPALALVAAQAFLAERREREKLQSKSADRERLHGEAKEWGGLVDERREAQVESLSQRGGEARVISAVVDLDGDLDRVLALGALSVGARSLVLFFHADDGERLVVRRAFEGPGTAIDREAAPRLGEGVIGHAARTHRPALFTNLDPGSLQPPVYRDETASPSLLVVPVVESGSFRGVLVADSGFPGAFGSDQERILVGFSGEIGTLLENARNDTQRERRGHRLEALRYLTQQLSSTIKIEEVLTKMVELTRGIVAYDRCALFIAAGGGLVVRAQRGFLPEGAAEVRVARGYGLPGFVAESRRPLLFSDLKASKRTVEIIPGAPQQERIRSFLGLPVCHQGELIGVWVLVADDPGRFDSYILDLLSDVAAQAGVLISNAMLHEAVERLSVTDGLTGLYNHRTFQERLQSELERGDRHREPVSLLLLDIDHFKKINDTRGHPFGDRVLKALAAELVRLARRVDFVARYGGEEFAIILVGTDRRGCRTSAQRVLKAVRALRIPGADDFSFTLSIGSATYPDDAPNREELVRRTDQALYAAKAGGRDRVVAYEGGGAAAPATRAAEDGVREAPAAR